MNAIPTVVAGAARLGDTEFGKALLFIATAIAVIGGLVAVWRWAMNWCQRRRHRQSVDRVSQYIENIPRILAIPTWDSHTVSVADEILADTIQRVERDIDYSRGKALRAAAALPAVGKIREEQTHQLMDHLDVPGSVRRRLESLYAVMSMFRSDGLL